MFVEIPIKINSLKLIDVSKAAVLPASTTCLKMIAQPTCGPKVRYRSDYEKNDNRLGVLKNTTPNSSYQGPAIQVNFFLSFNLF
jgi:hypothetical protein